MPYRTNRFPVLLLLFFSGFCSLVAQSSFVGEERILDRAGFRENVEVRMGMRETINAPFFSLLTRQKEIHEQVLTPAAVEFELRKSAESFYLLFKNEKNYLYPVWGRGNYIIKRDLKTGSFLQIKIFLQNDENSFIRLFPLDESRSVMDLMLYGVQLYQDIVVPVSLEELAVTPFTRLMHMTGGTVQWDLLFTDRQYPEWNILAGLTGAVRKQLATLHQADDVAQNREGIFVRIEDGVTQGESGGVNCSGFAKWVADGILLGRGERSGLIPLGDLKEPTRNEQESLENPWSYVREDRDPYFGLDWIRNLAGILKLDETGEASTDPKNLDVDSVPFFRGRENIGYILENLQTVLYLLAVENPGSFYMGAVNSPYGDDPVLWQYHHVVLFFPWFTEEGDFQLAVLETGAESSLENLASRYPDSFVHLVRVDRAGAFKNPVGYRVSLSE